MSLDPETRRRLLELTYDLLPEAEAAELRQRIAVDPELARAYAEAQDATRLFAAAARIVAPKIPLKRPERTMSTPSDPSPVRIALKPNGRGRSPWARGANWTVGVAAAVLLLVSIGGYWYHRDQLQQIAAGHIRLRVAGPAQLQAGAEAVYNLVTTTVNGSPMPAQIEFAVYSPDGQQLFGHKEKSEDDGRLQIAIPADKIPASGYARLEVLAVRQDKLERIDTRLAVEPIRYATQLSLDKPLYRPGETIYYRSLTLSRFALAAERQMPIRFEILDPSGAAVPDSQQEGATEQGVGNGAFTIPEELAGGEYVLTARSIDDAFPEEKRPFFISRYRLPRLKKELEFARDSYGPGDAVVADFLARRAEGGPAAGAQLHVTATVDGTTVFEDAKAQADPTGALQVKFTLPEKIDRGDGQLVVLVDDGGTQEPIVKTIPINLGKVEVKFYPEGGDLVGGLENRVYFTSRDPLGQPVHIEGTIVNAEGIAVARVETTHEGMGSFSFVPRQGEPYRLKITSPAGTTAESALPEVAAEQKIVLNTGTGVFDADKPLEFNIRAAEAGLPLVVSAWCRGVEVGQQVLTTAVTDGKSSDANPVVIPLAEEIGGVIRLTVHDYRTTPPKPVAERLVYRRMGRKLQVRAAGHHDRYSPGEKVEMSLLVTDENNKPVPAAVLGVTVVDDALLNLADDDTPRMPTQFLLSGEVEKPEDLEDADFYLGDDPKAAAALDLLLGTQGWRRFVEKSLEELRQEGPPNKELARLVALGGAASPPAMFDNLQEIQAKYRESLADYRADRTNALNTLTTVSFFAGLGLVLLVAMLGLLKIVSGVHLWVPAIGVTACALVIGAILMDPARLKSGGDVAVAFLPFNMAPPETTATSPPADKKSDATDKTFDDWGKPVPEAAPVPMEADAFGLEAAEKAPEGAAAPAAVPPAAPVLALERFDGGAGWRGDGRFFDREAGLKELGRMQAELAKQRAGEGKADMAQKLDEQLARYRFTVREYAHVHAPVVGDASLRSDFAETLFWHPLLITDKEGRAKIAFDLSDSITTFRLRADAHGGGRIGAGDAELTSRIPFNLEPKLPLEVNAGDRIDLPLAVVNDTKAPLPVELLLEHGDLVALDGDPHRKLELAAEKRGREYFSLEVTGQKGDCELTIRGTAGHLADAVTRPLKVVPPGFPKKISHSGQIDGPQQVVVELPETWVAGSLEVTLNAYPSTLADLQKGMESILAEPNGCFEQASTSNYPNVLSLQYLQEHDVANPAVTRQAKDLLKKGYVKLVGYESPQKGYEWFGGDPGHEALTAYGLMEFRDMAKVYEVDPEMVRRTAQWLLGRRDGKGGFQRNPQALDSFGGAPADITDAYIVWALSESGQEGIEAEVTHVLKLAEKSNDPYLIALAAAGAANAKKDGDAKKLLDRLAKLQAEDGHLEGQQGSITRSGGQSLQVETTALAALAWLKLPDFAPQANRAVKWMIASRQGSGGFGSTQATILALKALVEHSRANRRAVAAGKLIVRRDDMPIGEHAFDAGRQETIVVDGLEANLKPGSNRLDINLSGENKMPYALDVAFRTLKPESDANCPVRLSTALAKTRVKAGETVALTAELVNSTDQGQPMTIAVLGLPAGLEARPDQLDELKKAGTIDYYETRVREVICYWRSLAPKKKTTVKLDLVAAVPGRYVGPASRTYLYYTAEQKQWCEPLQVEIVR